MYKHFHSCDESSSSTSHQRLTNFAGSLVGVTSSIVFRSDVVNVPVDVGTSGPATGVNPVPPAIKLSKLKIPVEGVWMGIPGSPLLRSPGSVGVNMNFAGNELGRLGLAISPREAIGAAGFFDADDISGLLLSTPAEEVEEDEVESVFMADGGVAGAS